MRRGLGDRGKDAERRGEEESAPDSQDLSSAASLDRGNLCYQVFNICTNFPILSLFLLAPIILNLI